MRLCLSSSLIQIFRISRYHSCQHEISRSSPSQLRQSLLKPLNIMCGPKTVNDDEDSWEDTGRCIGLTRYIERGETDTDRTRTQTRNITTFYSISTPATARGLTHVSWHQTPNSEKHIPNFVRLFKR